MRPLNDGGFEGVRPSFEHRKKASIYVFLMEVGSHAEREDPGKRLRKDQQEPRLRSRREHLSNSLSGHKHQDCRPLVVLPQLSAASHEVRCFGNVSFASLGELKYRSLDSTSISVYWSVTTV